MLRRMMQNVEFKAELRDIALARTGCRALGASFEGELRQTDTYFRAADARFKRRETEGRETEYVLYRRPDRTRAKISRYELYSEEEGSERFGAAERAVLGVVRKVREVYLLENVRIHLDRVEGLGNFVEFEAVVSRACNVRRAHLRIDRLRRRLHGVMGEAISCGYIDLLETAAVN